MEGRHWIEAGTSMNKPLPAASMQSVCKHWRDALAAEPGTFAPSLLVTSRLSRPGLRPACEAEIAAAASRATRRARALAARAPDAGHLVVVASGHGVASPTPELRAAYAAALQALLARPVGGTACRP